MLTWTRPEPEPTIPDQSTNRSTDTPYKETTDKGKRPVVVEPTPEVVSSRSVKVSFDKAWLADEADVDRYLAVIRDALLSEIRSGKRIQI